MTLSQKLPQTYFLENRERDHYRITSATCAAQRENKHKYLTMGRLVSKKKRDVQVNTEHQYTTSTAKVNAIVELKFREI